MKNRKQNRKHIFVFIPLLIISEIIFYSLLFYTNNKYFINTVSLHTITLKKQATNTSTVFYDKLGKELYRSTNTRDDFYSPVQFKKIPPACIEAVIKIEDKDYYSHKGFNIKSILRAAYQNIKAGHIVSGASTITMQVVKLFMGAAKNMDGKLKQIALAWKLEQNYSKREILQFYLNSIYWGHNYKGIESAAQGYFQKKAEDLNPLQCLSLAVLIKAPAKYNVRRNFANNWKRIEIFLRKHPEFSHNYFNTYQGKKKKKFIYRKQTLLSSIQKRKRYPSYYSFIETFFQGKQNPANVYTSLDKSLQDKIQLFTNKYLSNKGRKKNISRASVIVLDNQSHSVRVWLTGNSTASKNNKWINGPLVLRQPGSTLKPFLYALALENKKFDWENTYDNENKSDLNNNNNFYHVASLLNDFSPENFKDYGSPPIRNYNDHYYGRVSFRMALGNSLNVAAAELLNKIGIPKFLAHLRLGPIQSLFRSSEHYGLGLILGDGEVSLLELVKSYSIFANAGLNYTIGAKQNKLYSSKSQYYSPGIAYLIYHILKDKMARTFSFGNNELLNFSFPVALKTGTSEGFRDNWIIGFTKLYTVGVWVGNFDRRAMINSTGLSGAGPIFKKVMELLHSGKDNSEIEISRPESLIEKTICVSSGNLANEYCPNRKTEIFAKPFVPKVFCTRHNKEILNIQDVILNSQGKIQKSNYNGSENLISLQQLSKQKLQILKPNSGAIYKINKATPKEYRKIIFKISIPKNENTKGTNDKNYIWKLNNEIIYSGQESFFIWTLTKGKYKLQILDKDNILAKTSFSVI